MVKVGTKLTRDQGTVNFKAAFDDMDAIFGINRKFLIKNLFSAVPFLFVLTFKNFHE